MEEGEASLTWGPPPSGIGGRGADGGVEEKEEEEEGEPSRSVCLPGQDGVLGPGCTLSWSLERHAMRSESMAEESN